ncbi:MAG: hypothetical protein F6J93_02480 [Oscillatoria sp. SIO1A7]|nr:hypothetical protein [Oscillatoria sp. SIO1A7]
MRDRAAPSGSGQTGDRTQNKGNSCRIVKQQGGPRPNTSWEVWEVSEVSEVWEGLLKVLPSLPSPHSPLISSKKTHPLPRQGAMSAGTWGGLSSPPASYWSKPMDYIAQVLGLYSLGAGVFMGESFLIEKTSLRLFTSTVLSKGHG